MSIQFARTMAVLWVITFLVTLTAGIACAVISEWRLRVSSSEVTPSNSVAFIEHGRTYFAPPVVTKWYDRSTSSFPPILVCLIAMSLIAAVAAWQSDAVGRRWRAK